MSCRHAHLCGMADLLLNVSLFYLALSFSLTCLLASCFFYFHIPTLFQWNLSKRSGSGYGESSVRVPYLPLNCKISLSRSVDGSGCTASEGSDQSGKIVRINQTLVGWMEREKIDRGRLDEEKGATSLSTQIYTSINYYKNSLSHAPWLHLHARKYNPLTSKGKSPALKCNQSCFEIPNPTIIEVLKVVEAEILYLFTKTYPCFQRKMTTKASD